MKIKYISPACYIRTILQVQFIPISGYLQEWHTKPEILLSVTHFTYSSPKANMAVHIFLARWDYIFLRKKRSRCIFTAYTLLSSSLREIRNCEAHYQIVTSLYVIVWISVYSKVWTVLYLPAWNTVLCEKPMVAQLLKELPKFYGTQRFIVMFK
jgi:hypothetical protein